MDEPTRGIDAAARSDIYAIITQLKEQGYSILLISSDLEEIEATESMPFIEEPVMFV